MSASLTCVTLMPAEMKPSKFLLPIMMMLSVRGAAGETSTHRLVANKDKNKDVTVIDEYDG